MTDQTDPRNQYPDDQDQHLPSDSGDYPVLQEPSEALAPRRAASAQFVVDAEIGSEAALREASSACSSCQGFKPSVKTSPVC